MGGKHDKNSQTRVPHRLNKFFYNDMPDTLPHGVRLFS